jgi:hypothetical protein
MRLSLPLFALIVLATLALSSCKGKDGAPDVSGIHVPVHIIRFDQDFFSMDTAHIEPALNRLHQKYPAFLPLYFEFLTPVNFMVTQNGKTYAAAVNQFYQYIKPLYDSAQKKTGNLDAVKKGFEDNLRYVQYYFPNYRLPSIFTTVESLNPEEPQEIYGTALYHDTLIISLQMFLGKDFSQYDPTQYFDYIRRRFEPEYIVPNSIRAIALALYPDSSQDASLIEQFIEKGKQWWLLDHLEPNTPDSLKTFFTGEQLQWCRENEGNIWSTILRNNTDLYTHDKESIQGYLGEAPFTQDMPHETSPGNIGQWIGWQIVRKFASRHSSLTLHEVLATPAKQIFQEAAYKPK